MKNPNLKITGFGKYLLFFTGLLVFSLIFGLVAAAAGITVAVGTVIADGTATLQAATEQDVLDIADVQRKVETYKQWQTPLLSLASMTAPLTVESWKAEYYAVDARGMKATISAATTISSNYVTTLTLSDNTMFTKFNTVCFTAITTKTTKISSGNFLMGIILSVGDSNEISVKLVNPGTELAASDFVTNPVMTVYRAGSAHNELAASTTAWGINPEKDYNYIQLFMEQIEEGEIQKLMKKEADWGMADLKKLAIEDFKMQRERTFLSGVKSKTTITIDGQAKDFYTCGGFLNDTGIPVLANQSLTTLASGSELFVTWLKTFFTANNGSRNRHLLAGADVMEAIEKIKVDNKWLTAKETSKVLGTDNVRMVSTFGSIDISYYEQLDLLGKTKSAIVVDPSNIYTGDLKGKSFGVRKLMLKEIGASNVEAAVIEQCSTMLIKNKKTHHIVECV